MSDTTAEEVQQPSAGSLKDVFLIRDIIFGEQMRAYDQQFTQHDAHLADLQSQITQLRALFEERQRQAAEETQRRMEELRTVLTNRLDDLDFRAAERAKLGDWLVEIGHRLKSNPS